MNNVNRLRVRCLFVSVMTAALGFANSATASGPPDLSFDLPAGLACSFDLRIEGWGGSQVYKEFYDKDGNLVRLLFAGTGSALTFTNLGTSATYSTKANGAVSHITLNPDGSATQVTTGHNIIILFPTDVPAGPSTTLYIGRVVISIDSVGNYTLLKASGTSTDICAALS